MSLDKFIDECEVEMQNRFKFRVWNKARQCFMTEKEIFICGNGELVLIDEALSRTWVKDNPNYKVSFCTGLKDKNGKLIYEGDIVKFKTELFGKPKQIIWDECHYILKDTFIILCDMKIKQFGLEVIGNIYENSELLEVEND